MLAPPRWKNTRLHQVRRRRAALAAATFASLVLLMVLFDGGDSPGFRFVSTGAPAAPPSAIATKRVTDSNRAIDKVRAYTPYVAVGSRRKKQIALTFDDGPGPLSPQFARLLKRKHVPATFFVVGQQFSDFEGAVRLEHTLGFPVANHTENHLFLKGQPAKEQRQQIRDDAARLRLAGVPYVRIFRPPGRSFDDTTFKTLRKMRLLMVLWTIDSRDYTRPGTPAIVKNVLSAAQPGAIVLMHDGGGDRTQTLAALPTIITRLRRRGYEFVSVPDLLAGDPPPPKQRIPAISAG